MSTAPAPARPVGLWLALFGLIAVWSAWRPHDGPTWAMETAPAFLGLLLLAASWRRFRFTPLAYWLLLAHATILFVGGHYTYAHVPAFDVLRDLLGTARNDFDKLGHFAQGFVPAVIARELIVRRALVRGAGWTRFFTVAVCLAISAAYELIEWTAAVALGSGADEFLGTQGDPWDTQKDMATALLGALLAVTLLAPLHDRQIARVRAAEG
ncbi:DUF2238 domain-containing protein [Plasticicumulans sp.]|uniref:DUF2238 domain-containing protein n=1 Tax=Plasticicumulans sp. TaxID=2307179 RepID=UPI00394BBC83